jgi:hypothetical protein
MPQSDTINELAKALANAQSQMTVAPFNKTNPHFKNKYADLTAVIDAVRKPLNDNGIAFSQMTEMHGGAFCLVTRLLHSSGQWMSGEYLLPANVSPQQLGSALTYAKRYSLAAIVGISSDEDDDAEGAQKEGQVTAIPRQNPHVTQPRDINDFEERFNGDGEQIDYIPVDRHRVEKLKVVDARPAAETLLHAMRQCKTPDQLITWAEEHAEKFAALPEKWISAYQGEYQAHLDGLRGKRKAA